MDQQTVEGNVNVQPLGESNILSITASSTTADGAARLANAYAQSALTVRDQEIRRQIDAVMQTVGSNPTPRRRGQVAADELQIRARPRRPDAPAVAAGAGAGRSSSGAPAWLVLVLAAIAGFTLGSIAALLLLRRIADERGAGRGLPVADPGARSGWWPPTGRLRTAPRAERGDRRVPLATPPARARAIATAAPSSSRAPRAERARRCRRSISRASSSRSVAGWCSIDLDLRRARARGTASASCPAVTCSTSRAAATRWPTRFTRCQGEPFLRLAAADVDARRTQGGAVRGTPAGAHGGGARRVATTCSSTARRSARSAMPLHAVPLVDHILVVARVGRTSRSALETARDLLRRAGRAATGYVIVGGVSRRRGRGNYPAVRARDEKAGGRVAHDQRPAARRRRCRRHARGRQPSHGSAAAGRRGGAPRSSLSRRPAEACSSA